jgi:hypothetical protein
VLKEPCIDEEAKIGELKNLVFLDGGEDIFLDSTRRRECIHTNRRREPLNCT